MGTVTSTPVVRIRLTKPSPITNVAAFRVALEDLNFPFDILPEKYKDTELGCIAFENAPFPKETHEAAFYYMPGVVTFENNEFVYTESCDTF